MTLLFIPIILVGFVFADIFVLILGGREYLNPELIPGQSTVLLFKIFVLYGIMLPLDRMTGVALNSMNKPEKDFYKVLVMVVANIIGDLIAVFIFKSLIGVALATWLFTFIGMVLGYHFINREINLKFSMIFKIGWASIIHYFCRKPLDNE
jgi:O-antigen/teichoic acid export membrane protein